MCRCFIKQIVVKCKVLDINVFNLLNNRVPTTPPEWLNTHRETYKDTLVELDNLKPAKYCKIGKVVKLPEDVPFHHLDLRRQRKLFKSLARFEIVKAKQSTPKRSLSNLRRFRNGSYLQIQVVSNEGVEPSQSVKKKATKVNSPKLATQARGKLDIAISDKM